MDQITQIIGFLRRYKYVVLVLLIGLVLMLIPGRKEETPPPSVTEQKEDARDINQELAEILSQIEGVGKVKVLLTIAAGEETIYEYDEDCATADSSNTQRRSVVILTDAERAQMGLVQRVDPPVYQGAIIVCQGGDRSGVRLSVVEAVASVTGLTADRITVLKMK